MKKDEAGCLCRVWLDAAGKVVSFHPVEDFELLEFLSRSTFERYTLVLAGSGYRFQ